MVWTQVNLTSAVGNVSIFLTNLRKEHWNVMKRILRYLREISKVKVCFVSRKPKQIASKIEIRWEILIIENLIWLPNYIFKESYIVVVETTKIYFFAYHKGRVYCNNISMQKSVMDEVILA